MKLTNSSILAIVDKNTPSSIMWPSILSLLLIVSTEIKYRIIKRMSRKDSRSMSYPLRLRHGVILIH